MFNEKIHNNYCSFLPEEYKGKNPSKAIVTTYSLDVSSLEDMIDELGMIPTMKKNQLFVFYDAISGKLKLSGNDDCIFSSQLRPVQKSSVFHPKVILLEYDEKDYVIFVSSKNITPENQNNCIAAAYGTFDDTLNENENNGAVVAELIGGLSNEFEDEVKRLKKVNFKMAGADNVKFLNGGKDIPIKLKELKTDNGLIIVSPYLKSDSLKDISISAIYSYGFTKDFDSIIKKNPDLEFYRNRNGIVGETDEEKKSDVAFHSKIYCWKDKDKTQWIIGSSNATNGGFKHNTEFNICFTTDIKDYEVFKAYLNKNKSFEKIEAEQLEDSSSDEKENELKKALAEFKNSILSAKIEKSDNGYSILIKKPSIDGVDFSIEESNGTSYLDNQIKIVSKQPFQFLYIKASKDGDEYDDWLNIYDMWDKAEQEIIDRKALTNLNQQAIKFLKHSQFGSRRNNRKQSNKSLSDSNNAKYANIVKKYLYEYLADRYRENDFNKNREKFFERLKGIEPYFDHESEENKEWLKFLNKIVQCGEKEKQENE